MRRKILLGAACAGACVTGVAAASVAIPAGDDTQAGPASVQPDGRAVTRSPAVKDSDGSSWAVRVYRSEAGLVCSEAGHVDGAGAFGPMKPDGSVQDTPVEAAGTCFDQSKRPLSVAMNHYPKTDAQPARAVLFGFATRAVTSISLSGPTGTRDVAVREDRTFIAPMSEGDARGSAMTVALSDGTRSTIPLATAAP